MKLLLPVGPQKVELRVGAKAEHIKVSLRTTDEAEGVMRHALVSAHLERRYRSLRATEQPIALTKEQRVALAGEAYRDWMGQHKRDPGEAEAWDIIGELLSRAGDDEALKGTDDDSPGRRAAVDAYCSVTADGILRKHGLAIDARSRELLIEEIRTILQRAASRTEAYADGDYSPDANLARFPPPADVLPQTTHTQGQSTREASKSLSRSLSLTDIFDRWKTHPEQEHITQATISSYSTAFRFLGEYLNADPSRRLKVKDATLITTQDIRDFNDHLMANGAKPRTVRDTRLAGIKSVLGWASDRGLLPGGNPVSGVKVKVRKEPTKVVADSGDKGFTDAEAKTLLKHAARYVRSRSNEKPKTAAAKRWVPWLCAYTGTRVGEMAQLRKQDVKRSEDGEGWVLSITHEAGTNKRKMNWDVPLHPHLIEQGFLEFVQASGDGHLFITPRPREYAPDAGDHKTKDPRGILQELTTIRNRLGEFVREVVPRKSAAPNHGWRHRFKTVGRGCGIDGIVLDKFAGHAPKTVSDGYGTVTLKTMRKALERMPRYQ